VRVSQVVNPTSVTPSLQIHHIDTIEKTGRVLNLADFLEQKWQQWEELFSVSKSNEMIMVIGGEAGFTDARMLYVWLKTWQEFSPEKRDLRVIQANPQNLLSFTEVQLYELLSTWRETGTSTLTYTRAPRIG